MLDGKNAIRGEYWPNDPTEFRRCSFSVLRYFAADIQNAYGPNVRSNWRNRESTLDGIITL
jgi:hypothetical protein